MVFRRRMTADDAVHGHSLSGRSAIVTGASSGIGVETARALARAGADVVLAVRNVAAGKAVADELRASLGPSAGKLEVRELDLADLRSVRAFVEGWRDRAVALLVNNAGVLGVASRQTAQGFELQVGTNHLGHFALTLGLLPALSRAEAGRVVTVASFVHGKGDRARLVAALERRRTTYRSWLDSYADSKLANVLFAKALAKHLPSHVETFSVNPGIVATNIATARSPIMGRLHRTLGKAFFQTPREGAATTLYGAVSPELTGKSGAYLTDCAVGAVGGAATDAALAEHVWHLSERAIQA